MSNKKHNKCAMRNLATAAKARLLENDYNSRPVAMLPPKDVTLSQKEVFLKLCDMRSSGKEIENPIKQLSDEEKMKTLSHEERQRYILQLSADYVLMKRALDSRLSKDKQIV